MTSALNSLQAMKERMDYMLGRLNGKRPNSKLQDTIRARHDDALNKIRNAVEVNALAQVKIEEIANEFVEEAQNFGWTDPEKNQANRIKTEIEDMGTAHKKLIASIQAQKKELQLLNEDSTDLTNKIKKLSEAATLPLPTSSLERSVFNLGSQILERSTKTI